MTIIDFIVVFALLFIIGGATAYIIKAKKSGKKCIGCPNRGCCDVQNKKQASDGCGNCGGSCHYHEENQS